jgi:hypothetical protein
VGISSPGRRYAKRYVERSSAPPDEGKAYREETGTERPFSGPSVQTGTEQMGREEKVRDGKGREEKGREGKGRAPSGWEGKRGDSTCQKY